MVLVNISVKVTSIRFLSKKKHSLKFMENIEKQFYAHSTMVITSIFQGRNHVVSIHEMIEKQNWSCQVETNEHFFSVSKKIANFDYIYIHCCWLLL